MAKTPDVDGPVDPDDPKEKFRQALERKNRAATDGVSASRGSSGEHGSTDTHAHGGRRQFRRKAGG